MPATKRLVLDLPAAEVDLIEARVAAGEFESASALVLDLLESEYAVDQEWLDSEAGKQWLAEGDEIVKRIDAGLETMIPIEEVFEKLHARLDARIAAEDVSGERKRA